MQPCASRVAASAREYLTPGACTHGRSRVVTVVPGEYLTSLFPFRYSNPRLLSPIAPVCTFRVPRFRHPGRQPGRGRLAGTLAGTLRVPDIYGTPMVRANRPRQPRARMASLMARARAWRPPERTPPPPPPRLALGTGTPPHTDDVCKI